MHDVAIGLDIEPEKGTADSGDLEIDLPNLFVAIGEAAEDRKSAVAIFIDEIQYFNQKELGALIMAMHKVQQRQLPLVLLGAGLPILPGLAGESKSYAERLFSFPDIGALSATDAAKALQDPAKAAGVAFESTAFDEVFRLTKGYPVLRSRMGLSSLEPGRFQSDHEADRQGGNGNRHSTPRSEFLSRALRSPDPRRKELSASDGRNSDREHNAPATSPMRLDVKVTSLGPVRAKLIKKGMIYSPAHGDMAFTVPSVRRIHDPGDTRIQTLAGIDSLNSRLAVSRSRYRPGRASRRA